MEYKILDSGYVSANIALGSQTQLGDTLRAGYTGSTVKALDLTNVLSSSLGGQTNINDNPQIGINDKTEIGKNTTENEVITINFAYKNDSPPTDGLDINYAYQLNQLKYTEGVKLLYVSGTGNMDTALMQIGEYYKDGIFANASPSEATGTVSTTTPYLPIIITNVKFNDSPNGKYIKVTIEAKITK